jgi:hypothetical protein
MTDVPEVSADRDSPAEPSGSPDQPWLTAGVGVTAVIMAVSPWA